MPEAMLCYVPLLSTWPTVMFHYFPLLAHCYVPLLSTSGPLLCSITFHLAHCYVPLLSTWPTVMFHYFPFWTTVMFHYFPPGPLLCSITFHLDNCYFSGHEASSAFGQYHTVLFGNRCTCMNNLP